MWKLIVYLLKKKGGYLKAVKVGKEVYVIEIHKFGE